MRISFSRVDKQKSRNYESLVYPTDLQTKFAYYGVDRLNWDKAFRRAAAAAQGKLSQADADAYQQMMYLCDNPVLDYTGQPNGDARQAACGKAGFSPKFGDLRYAFVNTIAEPVPNGLLGYGPNSVDPESGEIISANANVYTWGIESEGQYLL